ncbi:MAG TPA: GNAT family N-acetyltransferase [Parachlamydiaceae bacterium]|nr:GNAT family N-acetyltransferase [Parachlamydiaceae bacterium]
MMKTERLILRPWCDDDLEPFAKMNADPRVREYFPRVLTSKESDESVRWFSAHIQKSGWGFWAASLVDSGEFIGFIGLQNAQPLANFAPAVEIGWRLAQEHWGRGYATEGARAALKYGFDTLNLEEIVSYTALDNYRSRHVMEKIGMFHNPAEDFDYLKFPDGHPLRRHVIYRLAKSEWCSKS